MISAIVLAAGSGSRIKSDIAKQYIIMEGKPILYYSLKAFQDSVVDEIILVTRPQDVDFCKHIIIEETELTKVKKIIVGGDERYNSVENGLKALGPESQYVLIHDGARPFVDQRMIEDSIANAKEFGACTVGVPVKDTIKIIDDNFMGVSTPDRSHLYHIQTPQTFHVELIKDAYSRINNEKNVVITDDTMIIEHFLEKKVKVIEGSYTNIKITTPEDLEVAKNFLKKIRKTC